MRLSDITLYDVQRFLNSLSPSLSYSTIKKYKNCLSCMFNYAIKWGFMKLNPCIDVDVPKTNISHFHPVFLTMDEANNLLNCLRNEPLKYQIIVRLALQCGMRRGEIVGLTWDAIDFKNNTISIYQSTVSVKGGGTVISKTKTESSNRTIYVKKEILDLIKNLEHTNDLIFGYMSVDTVTSWFNKFLKKYNLKHMRFHDLRHTHATLLIANGIDMKTVSNRLGHSSINTTMNIYVHPLSMNDKKASEII